ncbi:MAG: NusA-like transcription termination signal-binding factor [Candidatus Hodarchaeota archaeon]
MPRIKMSASEMQYANFLSELTDSLPKDCVWDEDGQRIIFVTHPGQMGKIIGKGGETIRRVREQMDKDIDVVEYAEKAERFAMNALTPARIQKAKLEERAGKKVVHVTMASREKGRAIGKGGRNIARARLLLKRHFGIEDIIITTV